MGFLKHVYLEHQLRGPQLSGAAALCRTSHSNPLVAFFFQAAAATRISRRLANHQRPADAADALRLRSLGRNPFRPVRHDLLKSFCTPLVSS